MTRIEKTDAATVAGVGAVAARVVALPLFGPKRTLPPAWTADMEQARREAEAILATIDWSKRDIVINVPGTGGRTMDEPKRTAYEHAWRDGTGTLVFLGYSTDGNFPNSVPLGVEVLRLVLAGIAARGGDRRVFLYGESQGAWVIGEAMRDPAVRGIVTRAALMGHVWGAHTHYHDGTDPQVWEHSNPDDPVATPLAKRGRDVYEALGKVVTGDILKGVATLLPLVFTDTLTALNAGLWQAWGKVFPTDLYFNPHNYDHALDEALAFLRNGRPGGVADATQGVQLITDAARQAMIEAAKRPHSGPYTRD